MYWCALAVEGMGNLCNRSGYLSLTMWLQTICSYGEDCKWKALVNDIKRLSPGEQTSSLESFHNIVCNYTSKAVHYFHLQMEARLALAALHFNEILAEGRQLPKLANYAMLCHSQRLRKEKE